MNADIAMFWVQEAMQTAMLLATPLLGAALAVGKLLPETVAPILQIVALATTFLSVFVVVALVTLRSELQDMVNVAPRPIAVVVRKLFMLPQSDKTSGGG